MTTGSNYPRGDAFDQIRPLEFVNDSGEDMPPFCAIRPGGADDFGMISGLKPNMDGQEVFLNGPLTVASGDIGIANRDFPAHAAYDSADGLPHVGEEWGAKASSWELSKDKTGFFIYGGPVSDSAGDRVLVVLSCCRPPVPAKLSTASAPSTQLTSQMSDSSTGCSVASQTSFPAREKFVVRIDNELMLVTAKTYVPGATTWTVQRGYLGTTAEDHDAGATVTLADAYKWKEQIPPTSGNNLWTDKSGGLSGTHTGFPARERNQNCDVPTDTYVLLWEKQGRCVGSSTTTVDPATGDTTLNDTTTRLPVANRSSFPFIFPFSVRVGGEIMQVTGEAANSIHPNASVFTVVRGQYRTAATYHDLYVTQSDGSVTTTPVEEWVTEWTFDYCCEDEDDTKKVNPTQLEPGDGEPNGYTSADWNNPSDYNDPQWNADSPMSRVDDYDIAGWDEILIDTTLGSIGITGFDNGTNGQVIHVLNTGAEYGYLVDHNNNTTSDPFNRIAVQDTHDIRYAPGEEVVLQYHATDPNYPDEGVWQPSQRPSTLGQLMTRQPALGPALIITPRSPDFLATAYEDVTDPIDLGNGVTAPHYKGYIMDPDGHGLVIITDFPPHSVIEILLIKDPPDRFTSSKKLPGATLRIVVLGGFLVVMVGYVPSTVSTISRYQALTGFFLCSGEFIEGNPPSPPDCSKPWNPPADSYGSVDLVWLPTTFNPTTGQGRTSTWKIISPQASPTGIHAINNLTGHQHRLHSPDGTVTITSTGGDQILRCHGFSVHNVPNSALPNPITVNVNNSSTTTTTFVATTATITNMGVGGMNINELTVLVFLKLPTSAPGTGNAIWINASPSASPSNPPDITVNLNITDNSSVPYIVPIIPVGTPSPVTTGRQAANMNINDPYDPANSAGWGNQGQT